MRDPLVASEAGDVGLRRDVRATALEQLAARAPVRDALRERVACDGCEDAGAAHLAGAALGVDDAARDVLRLIGARLVEVGLDRLLRLLARLEELALERGRVRVLDLTLADLLLALARAVVLLGAHDAALDRRHVLVARARALRGRQGDAELLEPPLLRRVLARELGVERALQRLGGGRGLRPVEVGLDPIGLGLGLDHGARTVAEGVARVLVLVGAVDRDALDGSAALQHLGGQDGGAVRHRDLGADVVALHAGLAHDCERGRHLLRDAVADLALHLAPDLEGALEAVAMDVVGAELGEAAARRTRPSWTGSHCGRGGRRWPRSARRARGSRGPARPASAA